jgi:hypothetical protein
MTLSDKVAIVARGSTGSVWPPHSVSPAQIAALSETVASG